LKKKVCIFLTVYILCVTAACPVVGNQAGIATIDDGKLHYNSYSDRGDILPDFSYVGYKHGEEPIPKVPVKITLNPTGSTRSDAGNIIQQAKQEALGNAALTDSNYENIVVKSSSTTGHVLNNETTKQNFWKAIDGIKDDQHNRWGYSSIAVTGEKRLTLNLQSPKTFHTAVIYSYRSNNVAGAPPPLSSFRLRTFAEDSLEGGVNTPDVPHSGLTAGRVMSNRIYRDIVKFNSPVKAQYISLYFTAVSGNPGIHEIELYNDDSQMIQDAIDSVSALQPDENGIRGSVLLKKGLYTVAKPLEISASGVVLRGEGQGNDGTILYANSRTQYTVITLSGSGTRQEEEGTRRRVIDDYVPVGSQHVLVNDASGYNPGDEIVLHVQKQQSWIDELEMGAEDRFFINSIRNPIAWTTSAYQYHYEKTVTATDGGCVYFDVPIVDSLNQEYDVTDIYKMSWPTRIEKSAVEDLRIESYFDPAVSETRPNGWWSHSDLNHATTGISVNNAVNSWVKNVTSVFMSGASVSIGTGAKCVTVEECEFLDGVSPILGGYRSSFTISGQQNLVMDCYSFKSRHDFSVGQRAPGPNVFTRSEAEHTYSSSETHQRWATGVLFDNIKSQGPGSGLAAVNRGDAGTGHGWTGAQVVFWNCNTPLILAMKPPTAQNFVIGAGGIHCSEPGRDLSGGADWTNAQSQSNFTYDGVFAVGDAHFEQLDDLAQPLSLYERQMKERVGKSRTALSLVKVLENGEVENIDKPKIGKLRAEALVKNTSEEAQDYQLIMAVYKNDCLTNLAFSPVPAVIEAQKQGKLISDEIIISDTENIHVSVFIWHGIDILMPAIESKRY